MLLFENSAVVSWNSPKSGLFDKYIESNSLLSSVGTEEPVIALKLSKLLLLLPSICKLKWNKIILNYL